MKRPPTALEPHARPDTDFPAVHVRPAVGWMNDPNGPFRWNGRFHLFFQHNPHSALHADVCWGHASSDDLAHWQEEPVALVPTPASPDAGGCWSGCVVDDNGTPTAVYTGVRTGPDTATVCLAYAQDDALRVWHKDPTPVAAPPPGLELVGFRDPFLFTFEGHRYAIVGAGLAGGGAPVALLYACDDLRSWRYLGPLLGSTDPVAARWADADIWECPQLFAVGGRWVLLVSLWTANTLGRVAYLVGDLVDTDGGPRFSSAKGGLVDAGHDFYAPAVLATDSVVLLWGWSWEDRDEDEVVAARWAGSLTFPRALAVTPDDRLVSTPAPQLDILRTSPRIASLAAGNSALLPLDLPPRSCDLEIALRCPGSGTVTLQLGIGDDPVRLTLDLAAGRVALNRPVHDRRRAGWITEGDYWGDKEGANVRVIIDGSVLEVYVTDGPVFTERVYAVRDDAVRLELAGPQQAQAVITAWELTGA